MSQAELDQRDTKVKPWMRRWKNVVKTGLYAVVVDSIYSRLVKPLITKEPSSVQMCITACDLVDSAVAVLVCIWLLIDIFGRLKELRDARKRLETQTTELNQARERLEAATSKLDDLMLELKTWASRLPVANTSPTELLEAPTLPAESSQIFQAHLPVTPCHTPQGGASGLVPPDSWYSHTASTLSDQSTLDDESDDDWHFVGDL